MALCVLRKISANLAKANFFCIMCDECTDAANREQLVVCIRWVDRYLEAHEEFIGLYQLENIEANTIVSTIRDMLKRLNLPMHKCRGQCYDGASTMRGPRSGVAKQLLDDEPKALLTHCYSNSLNLAISDTVKGCKVMKDALYLIFEVTKLVKYSPKRDVQFEKLKSKLAPDTPGFRVPCPTRWIVRAASFKSVLDNYTVLQKLWDRIAAMTVNILKSIRNDECFDMFQQKIERACQCLDVEAPRLPRKWKAPKRYDDGRAEPEFFEEPFYRQQYYEALDLVLQRGLINLAINYINS